MNITRVYTSMKNELGIGKPRPLSEEKQLIYDIVKKLCSHSKSNLVMAPRSNKYLIENKQENYFCIITLDNIRITNHNFYKEITLELKHLEALIEIFKDKVEEDRSRMENEAFNNNIELLNKISESLNE